MIEPAFRSLLVGNEPVAAIVADRVYFSAGPQDERRARIVLRTVSAVPGRTFKGRAGYVTGRMQVDCLAPTYPQAKQLTKAALSALDNYSGTVADVRVDLIECEDAADITTAPLEGKATPTFGVSIDARFMYHD